MKILSVSPSDTINIGKGIAKELNRGDIVCLFGQLGSGKTVLTKGIAEGLGIKRSRVISPSFVLIREHLQGKLPLYHFDLYRLASPEDILGLGYEEYLYAEGISVIEWADRLRYLLPAQYLKIEISIKKDKSRAFALEGLGRRYKELTKRINEDIRR